MDTENMALESEERYNSNTFGIPAQDEIFPVLQDSNESEEPHKNFLVYNIGRTEVYAELVYGTKVMWDGVADTATIQPGEKKILDNGGSPYYVTGLKVYNKTDIRAIVHCATSDDDGYYLVHNKEPGTFDTVGNTLLKDLFVMGVKHVPSVESGLSGLVSTFWPGDSPSVWDRIQEKIKTLMDETILERVGGILSGDLNSCKDKITALVQEIDGGGAPEELSTHYMEIVQDLDGFEKKFTVADDVRSYRDGNKYLLPHYSALVLMKVTFCTIGIQQKETFGLTDENVSTITSYMQQTIQGDGGANKYITDLYKERVDHAYNKKFSEDLYDCMMNARTLIATQGLEYIQIWNKMFENPTDNTEAYNDVISYSTFYGRQTADLIKEAIIEELSEPLTPKLVDGKRNKIASIDVYLCHVNDGPAKVGGMKVSFEDESTYTMGTESEEVEKIEFSGALLNKLEVFGVGAIDYLAFYFSDERTSTCGTKETDENTVFELQDHHIVSLFLANDNYSLGGQAANICVAYQLNEKSAE